MNLDNQTAYWNKVAESKTFTHPLDISILRNYLRPDSVILDYGCGYGRLVKELNHAGFINVRGFDTSNALINRGKKENDLPLFHIHSSLDLPVQDQTAEGILLFAVLTCIPSNQGQIDLIEMLNNKLKPNGILYISDYYLQNDSTEMERYSHLNEDQNNYGIFSLPEGATFRHHTKEWISELTKGFKTLVEKPVEVKTMNGHAAMAFQLVLQKL